MLQQAAVTPGKGWPITCRIGGPLESPNARWVLTSGVQSLGSAALGAVIEKIQAFGSFNRDNDPHGEHDFGVIEHDGTRVLWKIEYYNHALDGGSPDPADRAVTCRVLTLVLAQEY